MQDANELIVASTLPISKDRLIDALLPRIGLTSYPWVSKELPLGASRFGGPVDLPQNMQWPFDEDRPLLLLAQINFFDLPIRRDHPVVDRLPKDGWLCLFLDVNGWASGHAGQDAGVVTWQFESSPDHLVRHDPEPPKNAEVWTCCHSVTAYPADHLICLPDADAVDSPLLESWGNTDEIRDEYQDLVFAIDDLKRTRHEVTLLGTPKLFNPDLRDGLDAPTDWMLLLEFDGECSWLAGVGKPGKSPRIPSFGGADFVQYFVRKNDYQAGRLDQGFIGYMMT